MCVLQFEDVDSLTVHLGSLLHFREKLYKKYNEAQEQVDQLRQALAALEDQHHVIQLQKNNELSQLQSDLEETHSEVLLWVLDINPEYRPACMLFKN